MFGLAKGNRSANESALRVMRGIMWRFNSAIALLLLAMCLAVGCSGEKAVKPSSPDPEVSADPEVSGLLRSDISPASYPEADIVRILHESTVEVQEDGNYQETVRYVFKILAEAGKARADLFIGFDSRTESLSLLYARTITPDGSVIPLKESATQVVTPYSRYPKYSDYKVMKFSMPGAGIGAVVDYKYVREAKPFIKGHFNGRFFFQGYEPVLLSRYEVLVPEGTKLKHRLRNPLEGRNPSPVTSLRNGKRSYNWEYKNVPQILPEENMPPFSEVAFNIMVTTIPSWGEFCDWWWAQVNAKPEPDQTILEKVADLTKGLTTTDEKAQALFDYVKREIRYVSVDLGKCGYVPERAPEVIRNKYGDCKDKSTLLISMLRAAGIPAHYVLIPTSSRGNLLKDFSYPFQFNHCIVATESGEGFRFLDPTGGSTSFGYLPAADQNRGVIVVKEGRLVFTETPRESAHANGIFSKKRIRIMADGSADIEIYSQFSGAEEALFRFTFGESNPALIKQLFEKVGWDSLRGARLLDYDYSDPLDYTKKFEFNASYSLDRFWERAGDILILPTVDDMGGCVAADTAERAFPIVCDPLEFSEEEIRLSIPEGYKVHYLPDKVEIVNPYFEYRSSYHKEGSEIVVHNELVKTAAIIAPEDYAHYRSCCQMMRESRVKHALLRKRK